MKQIAILAALAASALTVSAQSALQYSATAIGQTATGGDFAPYFIGALNHGKTSRAHMAGLDLGVSVDLGRTGRWGWGAGAEVMFDGASSIQYARYDAATSTWGTSDNNAAPAYLQQLYAEVRYRSVFLRAGQKDYRSALLDEDLSSGDLVRGANARGIPGAEIGFIGFQDIPLTNGWVQIDGVIEYGRTVDDAYKRKQFNYYKYILTQDVNYTYKRCYFRTKPSMPLSVTVGMQVAGQFGGSTRQYRQGRLVLSEDRGFRFGDVLKMFLPTQGNGNEFYEGNTLGSWDLKARYRLPDGSRLSFVFQGPWEDGSGIGRANGFDGLWGLYYTAPGRRIVTGAAIEYLDFTNQSGPMHWAPSDSPGTDITTEATGRDNYYNNTTYGAYTNYGLCIGSPFMLEPFYNLNGMSGFIYNVARGFHASVRGCLGADLDYSVRYSYQHARRCYVWPGPGLWLDNSMMARVDWHPTRLAPGWNFGATLAFDAGNLRGNNFGAMLTVTYSGLLPFKKR